MKVCMIVPDVLVKGGIAAVVNGYRDYDFGMICEIKYIESYCNGSKWKKLIKAIKGYFEFYKQLRKDRPDLIHIHSSFGPSFYRKIPFIYMAKQKKIPIINHIHGAEFNLFFLQASDKKKNFIKKIYNKCDKLIALSDEWKENLKKIVPEEKIEIIENYCIIPALPEREKKNQVLFLGEIGRRKGCFDIPAVLEQADLEKTNVRVVIAGDGTRQDVEAVKEMLTTKKLFDKTEFTGWVRGEEKAKLLEESGIFLFPSYHEGMPIAILEAMAYGMAIITTKAGGIPKLIQDGIDGYLCEPGDIGQLAGHLKELLWDADRRKEMGDKARKKAIQNYSRASHIKRLLLLYNKMAEENKI